jgi:hypothetical protein
LNLTVADDIDPNFKKRLFIIFKPDAKGYSFNNRHNIGEVKKMNIEQVIKNLKKIDGSRDIWRDIIKAFEGFSFNGVTEVAIESQMDDEIVQAFIDTDGSPVIQIALDQWADGTYVVIDASQLR